MTDDATLRALLQWMVRQLVEYQAEISALRMALTQKDLLTSYELDRHRVKLLKGAQPLLDQLDDAQPDKILEMLRNRER
jgi:hypothetical protein